MAVTSANVGELLNVAAEMSPDRLQTLLGQLGWHEQSRSNRGYSRWVKSDRDQPLLLPLDRDLSDFEEMTSDLLAQVWRLEDGSRNLLSSLVNRITTGDALRFERNLATRAGAIQWTLGEQTILGAKQTLLAAAKSHVAKRAYYGRSLSGYAKTFLESCLMGQTDINSFVVTAYTPNSTESFTANLPATETNSVATQARSVQVSGPDVVESLSVALTAIKVAVVESQAASSATEPFEESVRFGVSAEMLEAVRLLAYGSTSTDIEIVRADPRSSQEVTESFEFLPTAVPQLIKARDRLSTVRIADSVTISGWAKVLSRPARGKPGVVRIQVRDGGKMRSVRVQLTADQFDAASDAIRADEGLTVTGRQEKRGSALWLVDVDAASVTPMDAVDENAVDGALLS